MKNDAREIFRLCLTLVFGTLKTVSFLDRGLPSSLLPRSLVVDEVLGEERLEPLGGSYGDELRILDVIEPKWAPVLLETAVEFFGDTSNRCGV